MIDIEGLLNQAQQFQQQMKDDLNQMAVSGSSAGGAVRVVVNGNKEITNIEFEPGALKDPDLLADMVLAAVNGAYAEVEQKVGAKMPSALGNMDLSAFANLLKQ